MQPDKWDVLASEYLVDNRWLRLRKDRCRLPNGNIIEDFFVTEYTDWVNVLALTEEQEVVLVRQYRHGRSRVALELPGGMIEAGQNPAQAARLELLQETGFEARQWHRLGAVCANPDNHTNQSFSYLALGAHRTGQQQLDANEIIAVELVPLPEFVQMAQDGQLDQALHITSLFWALNYLKEAGLFSA